MIRTCNKRLIVDDIAILAQTIEIAKKNPDAHAGIRNRDFICPWDYSGQAWV